MIRLSKSNKAKFKNNTVEFMTECYYIDLENQILYTQYKQKITFKALERISKKIKNNNVIHKPFYILLFQQIKAGDITGINFIAIENDDFYKKIKEFKPFKDIRNV
jgi:hypothetical protein